MSLFDPVRKSVSLKLSLSLALLITLLFGFAGALIVWQQTRELEADILATAVHTATQSAREYGEKLEDSIDSGLLTVADVFDRNYVEIKGYDWGKHPRYHTRYDSLTDRLVVAFQDQLLEDKDYLYALGVDENGYAPTHNSIFQQRPNGDGKDDLINRTKRKFDTPDVLTAARSTAPSLVQEFVRDTGERAWDVSAPINVKGKHWGGFRIGVSRERIDNHVTALAWRLVALFGAFAVVTIVALFFLTRRSMQPVKTLTDAAIQISIGEALDASIKSSSPDELGELANAIERLRLSLKAAMSRLGGV